MILFTDDLAGIDLFCPGLEPFVATTGVRLILLNIYADVENGLRGVHRVSTCARLRVRPRRRKSDMLSGDSCLDALWLKCVGIERLFRNISSDRLR